MSMGNSAQLDELEVSRAIQHRFEQSAYRSLRQVRCEWRDGALTLFGEVPTFFLKQMAQTIAASVNGAVAIANQIDVTSYFSARSMRRA